MTTITGPDPSETWPRHRAVALGRALAWSAGGVGLAALATTRLPGLEATLVAYACRSFSPRTMSYGSTFLVDLGTVHTRSFQVGVGCSAAVMLLPLLLCATVLLVVRAAPVARVGLATLSASLLVLAVNLARIVFNAWVVRSYGEGLAFTISHLFVGSLVSLVLAAVACWLFLRLALPAGGAGRPGGFGLRRTQTARRDVAPEGARR